MQEYERKFEQSSEDQKFSKLCFDAGLKLVEQGHYFHTIDREEGQQMQHLRKECTMFSNEKGLVNTVSWVRIVTCVDKYVTESMLTTKEEDIASVKPIAKARPRQKPTVTLTSVSIRFLKESVSILKHNDHTIISVVKFQRPSPDCYDMINQSLEEAMEQSTAVTSSKSARRKSSTMLRNGYLKIGYQLWQEEEELK